MFNAINMSRAARQAAKFNGLSTVHKYEIIDYQTKIVSVDDPNFEQKHSTVVMRAYSKNRAKQVDISAGDLYMMETEYQDAPLARIV